MSPDPFSSLFLSNGGTLVAIVTAGTVVSTVVSMIVAPFVGTGLVGMMALGAIAGGVDYLVLIGMSNAIDRRANDFTWGGLGTQMAGGAAGGAILRGGGVALSRMVSAMPPNALSPLTRLARSLLEVPLARLANTQLPFRIPLTLSVRLSRFFATATRGYVRLAETRIGRFLTTTPGLRSLNWEQGHWCLQQCWWRSGGPRQLYPMAADANRGLRSLGNAGWNLIPMPRVVNRFLGQNPNVSLLIGSGIATLTVTELYVAGQYVVRISVETSGLVRDYFVLLQDDT